MTDFGRDLHYLKEGSRMTKEQQTTTVPRGHNGIEMAIASRTRLESLKIKSPVEEQKTTKTDSKWRYL
ncbi:hypothetical protein [Desmospora activa]|uniref:Uncharacterized protein n=1 Tax=Desmospora activa DSM 45169 TaxID=1121389 RepID=A0A2T4YYY2_9BACL|nr:hypothetical protein [Desmospora activa]PTM52198.1 hypothetical protein C8J48_3745 [Desmospora activa DSM 45169]